MSNIRPYTFPTKRLANSITSIATSLTLSNIAGWDGDDLTTSTFNSSTGWPGVLRNETNTQYELVELDTTTLVGNTMDITKRGLGYDGTNTAGTETAYDWNGIETLVELGSNPPQLYEDYTDHKTNESVTGTWTITSTGQWVYNRFPTVDGTPVSSSDLANKGYVDSIGISPTPYAANIISGNGSTSYSKGSVIYYSSSDQLWYPSDADATTSFANKVLGITQSTSNTSGDSINILLGGNSTSVSTSLTAGTKYYLGNTTGSIATTGTYVVPLGVALSSTNFLFQPFIDNTPVLGQSGNFVSSSNYVIDNSDTTSAATANKIVRRDSSGGIIVPITPTSSSQAVSKDYVDYTPTNSISTSRAMTTFNITHPFSTSNTNGWQSSGGAFTVLGHGYEMAITPTSGGYVEIPVMKTVSSGASYLLRYASYSTNQGSLTISFPFMVTSSGADATVWGLITGFTTETGTTTGTNYSGLKFAYNWGVDNVSTSLYAVTVSSGVAAQATLISSSVISGRDTLNDYKIEWKPGISAKYYINEQLVATHTTSLPNSSGAILQYGAYCHNYAGAGNSATCYIGDALVSYEY